MTEISNYVKEQYNKLAENEIMPISEDSVKEAIRYIDDFDLTDSKSLFTIVAALNLLNAAIKRDDLKSSLYYGYIKTNVSKVADYYIAHRSIFEEASVYYEKQRNCFYFNIFDVVFSFHQLKETDNINLAVRFEPIIWPGIRLQRIAQFVFEQGKKMDGVKSFKANKDVIIPTTNNISLIPCPDCGRMISNSARFSYLCIRL